MVTQDTLTVLFEVQILDGLPAKAINMNNIVFSNFKKQLDKDKLTTAQAQELIQLLVVQQSDDMLDKLEASAVKVKSCVDEIKTIFRK